MKYHSMDKAAKKEDPKEEGSVQYYTRNSEGQFELWKPEDIPLLVRVIGFLKALRT